VYKKIQKLTLSALAWGHL